ncbi:hypothetical protein AURDEDRAFT_177959 [Auricularia subglabra TFB-10046 SS5]|uniref:Uncharacterized protein n=1 Tax=Auricularia subglabra (strain TFB-10046 / SS5) TaxID=717982 RepID=J0D2T9_AURST|nr:hypothetical protein AURDEDRAFT_177959 [Auricularia subglabra TFB-10046 SS5]
MSERPKRARKWPTQGPSLVAYRASGKDKPAPGPAPSAAKKTSKRSKPKPTSGRASKAPPKPKAATKKAAVRAPAPEIQLGDEIDLQMSEESRYPGTPDPRHSPTDFPFFSPDKGAEPTEHGSSPVSNNDEPITVDSSDDAQIVISSQDSSPAQFSDDGYESSVHLEELDLLLDIPTPDGDVCMSFAASTTYKTLVRKLHAAIGCSNVTIKPIFRAQTGANPRTKDSKLALNSEETWRVIVDDALTKYKAATAGKGKKAQAERASQPKVKIWLNDDYIQNLQHTRALSNATGGGNGNKKRRGPIDLNALDPADAAPSSYDLSDRQRNASKDVNAEYKSCKIGRCNGPCVRINDRLCRPVSQAMLSTLIDAIANQTPGVTVTNPPQLPVFDIWPGRGAHQDDGRLPQRTSRRSRDRFSPYQPSHHRRYRETSPGYFENRAPTRTPRGPMVAINSTSFTSLNDPSIAQFLNSLHEYPDYARRNLDRLIPAFETRDFYSISSISSYSDLELTQRIPEVSAGNAVFILSAVTQYLRSVPS